jgi:fibronectin type 3 domain-containing protein
MKKIIVLIGAIICSSELLSQDITRPGIKVIARVKADSVILRWGTTTPVSWEIANQSGYLIRRYTVSRNNELVLQNPETITVTPKPILPLPLAGWEPLVKSDKYSAIAAQALYGKSFKISNPGNASMQFVDQVQEKESRWSFALFSADNSTTAAKGLGLRFVDKGIKKNEKYVYKVFLANPNPKYLLDTGAVFVDPAEKFELPPPEDLKAEFGDRSVSLHWNTFFLQPIYNSYKIERSDDEGTTYKPTSDLVFVNTRPENGRQPQRTYYLDSLPQNLKVYFYRISGNTPFGETGPPSAIIKGSGISSANGIVPTISFTHVFEDGNTMVQWKYPKEMQSRIKGFNVGRATSAKGPFMDINSKLLSPSSDSYRDNSPQTINYYVVKAVGQDGQTATSFPYMVQLEDNTPPAPPKGLKAKVDKQGIATLEWSKNQEEDLIGYRVFKANNPTEEFSQITKDAITNAKFIDTVNLQTLTKHIYYKVVAVDNRFNASDFSSSLEVERPDVVPPSASQFSIAESVEGKIVLEWFPSVSNDVDGYELYRAIPADTTLALLKYVDKDSSHFTDSEVQIGKQYRYKLVVLDKTGLKSMPVFVSVNCVDNGVRPSITQIQFKADREARQITLQWSYAKDKIRGFQLFKVYGNNPIRLYKFIDSSKSQFIDKDLKVNTIYGYALKAIFDDGSESELSEIIKVEY